MKEQSWTLVQTLLEIMYELGAEVKEDSKEGIRPFVGLIKEFNKLKRRGLCCLI